MPIEAIGPRHGLTVRAEAAWSHLIHPAKGLPTESIIGEWPMNSCFY
jgi:hypothetical protein